MLTDGVAFNAKDKECVFLEFTRPMDSVTTSDEGDWVERKETEMDARFAHHRYFINYLSAQRGRQWKWTGQLHDWYKGLAQRIPV